ncbi:MAG: hypothetical protein PHY35_02495 [Candidatus Omnitrophica bacterium]|nr:hypothetical protein [Candidatus Omnitrophota bacterium]
MQGKAVNYTLAKEFFPVVAEGSFIPKISNLSNWAYYFEAVFLYVTPLLALVFIFSTYLLYKSKKLEKELFIWIIFPYFIFSLLSPKDARYFFPVFPAIALLTALGIEELKNRIFKNIALVLLFTFGITNYYAYSYLGCDLFIKYRLETKQSLFYIHPPFKNNYYSVVIKFLKEIEKRGDLSQTNIGLISPGGEFDLKGETSIVTYYLASYKPAFSWSNSTKAGFFNGYKKYNYLIVISDPVVFKPDFRQLLAKNGSLNTGNKLTTKEKADDAIKYFETFKIIKRDILQGFDKKDIFLISKD